MSFPQLKKVFEKIKTPEKLREILTDFYGRMTQDTIIGFFFQGIDLERVIQKQSELLLYVMGASPEYIGKSPQTAHLHLPKIRKGHFDRRLKLLSETLADHGLNETEIGAWVAFEAAFRETI